MFFQHLDGRQYRPKPLRLLYPIVLGLLLNVCHADLPGQASSQPNRAWSTDVIGIEEMHLSVEYWVNQSNHATAPLMTPDQILAFKKAIYRQDANMVDIQGYPKQVNGEDVRDSILKISKPNRTDLFDPAGEILTKERYEHYTGMLNLDGIPQRLEVSFALVVERTDMRTYPTADSWFRERENDEQNLDRFQENGLFPGDAVAVLHTSSDGAWSFVQSYNYAAWVRSNSIAVGDRQLIRNYKTADDFLVITGDKVFTAYNTEIDALSELQLDMGIRLPLADLTEDKHNLYGQNPYTSHTILLPVRSADGALQIRPALIARSQDVNRGYLPFTRENLIRQAFKFLGERYGWGHSFNARDCTGFVMEVYKTFGIFMPRNTGQQGEGDYGQNTRFDDSASHQDKLQAFKNMDVGDLIYVPGHVLMYIGDVDGEPYVIHDVSIFRYTDDKGEYYEGKLNSVSVTPLIPLYGTRESSYMELMYNIKRIR